MSGADFQIGGLLIDLWQDLQQPNVVWQIGVLLICFALAWSFDRLVGQRMASGARPEGGALAFGQRGLKRLSLPVAMLLLTLAARPLLAYWHSINLLSLAIPLLTSLVVIRAVMFAVRHSLIARAPWLAGFERTLAFLAWSVVALHILGVLPELIALMQGIGFSVGNHKINLWLILQGLGAVLAILLVTLWVGGAIEARLLNAPGLDGNLRLVFARLARALFILLAVLIGLPLVGIDLTMLSVFGGALGVGLGFGLQKIAANYVSGFIILLDHSIRIGNMIAVGNERGVVTRITTRYTVLLARSGLEMIVPNEMLVSSVITNETYSDHKVRIPLKVQVAYGSNLEQVQQILIEAALTQPRVLADPAPRGHVAAFGDSGVDFELRFWIGDPENGLMQVKSDIYLAIWKAFKAAGIEIPFPQREVRLLQ